MNKSKGLFIAGAAVLFVQLIITAMTVYRVVKFDALPKKFIVLMVLLLSLLLIIVAVTQIYKVANIIGDLVSVVIIGVLIFVYVAIGRVDRTLESGLKPGDSVENAMLLIALADSPYKEVSQVLDKRIGIAIDELDKADSNLVITRISESQGVNLTTVEFDDNFAMAKALLHGEIEAMVLNSAYMSIMNDAFDSLPPGDPDYIPATIAFRGKVNTLMTVPIISSKPPTNNSDGGFAETPVDRNEIDTSITPFIIYVSGIDVMGNIATVSRSDVNVLVAVNPVTKQIAMVTTPRDSYVIIPGIADDSRRDKLTHAGLYGVEKSMAALENLYGINIDYYVRVNFTSVVDIVDLLGGVTVYSEHDFTERFQEHHFVQGYNDINGENALYFARERYTIEGGDVSRGKNHIELIKAILNKAMSPAIINNYAEILSTCEKNIETNMTKEEMVRLIKMQLNDMASWNYTSYATSDPGGQVFRYCKSYSASKLYVSILTEESVAKAADLIEMVLNGEDPSGSF